jgi:hypothetical protein
MNKFDQKSVYEACIHACTVAVRDGFPHLAMADILDPPHQWFDAALARQVVMHLMIREVGWPKRRVVEVEQRSREAINRALRTIDRRMESPRFARHYQTMKERARSLIFLLAENSEAA